MPWRVAHVTSRAGFVLDVRFLDGTEGSVDMQGLISSAEAGVFAKLSDELLFMRAHVRHGAVVWPGDLDLAPDAMYRAIKASGRWVL